MSSESFTMDTVFLVDDDQDMRESIEWTLRNVGYDVKTFPDAPACLRTLESKKPDCVVVDLLLPGMTGLKLCEKIKSCSNCAFVMISGHGDVDSAVQAMKLGAVDFLEKPFNHQKLLDAVHRALEIAKSRQEQITEELSVADKLEKLSSREKEVFACLADGLVTKQIATHLGISPKTVDVHRSNISQKLDIDSPTQLAHVIYLSHRCRARKGLC